LKQLFHYSPENTAPSRNRTILLEYGENFCCWAVWSRDANRLLKLNYYTFSTDAQRHISTLIDVIRKETETVSMIVTCSYFPQSVLVPYGMPNEGLASVVFRDKHAIGCIDNIREKKMINSHLVPSTIHSSIRKNFPHSPFFHAYTPYLRSVSATAPNNVSVHFAPGICRVIVTKVNQLQLTQIYTYSARLDMVYILLKIFSEWNMPKEETVVYLSGLIEKDSALYEDLYAYFLNLEFAVPPTPAVDGEEYPAHYFTSLANLAKCVS
jgi:hypothetical protein